MGARSVSGRGRRQRTSNIDNVPERSQPGGRGAERRFQALIENSMDAITILAPDGTTAYESPSVERILGYRPQEVTGDGWMELIHPDDLPVVASLFADLIEHPGKVVELHVRFRHKNGLWRTMEGVGHNLIDDPDVAGIIVNYRDVTERKNAEQALRESERLHRALAENVTDVIWTMDMSLNFTYVSPSAQSMLGYDPEVETDIGLADVLTPASLREAIAAYGSGLAAEASEESRQRYRSTTVEMDHVHKDGRIVPAEVRMSFLRDDDGTPVGILGVARDITDRRKAMAALQDSEARFRTIFEQSGLSMALIDLKGRVISINPAAERTLGYSIEEMRGMSPLDYVHPDDVRQEAALFWEMAAGRLDHYLFEKRYTRKSGETAWGRQHTSLVRDASGEPQFCIALMEDFTERRRAEEHLRESEEKLKRYLESSPDGIYITDLDGTLLYGNRAAGEIVGYSKEELTDSNFLETGLLPHKYISLAAQTLEDNRAGKPTGPLELELIRKDGSMVWVEVSTYPIGEGDRAEVIGIARDISERKHMEQQLQLAGRLAAVGELAAGVAHELNNPLAAVQAFAQFLADRKDLAKAARGDVDTIYREAQRAARITANLLSFARKHEPERSQVSINEVIETSVELHRYRMKVNNMEIELRLDPNLPPSRADFHQMQQVFVNLITNASQAMTEVHGKGKLRIMTSRHDSMIQASFADDGPGIPEGNLERIFDPFFTTKDVGKGTGLGLSICYGIVQEHGGNMYAASKPGEGAVFTVEIPVASDPQPVISDACYRPATAA